MTVSLQFMPWIAVDAVDAVVTPWWFLILFVVMPVVTVNHMRRNVPMQYPG